MNLESVCIDMLYLWVDNHVLLVIALMALAIIGAWFLDSFMEECFCLTGRVVAYFNVRAERSRGTKVTKK